MDREGVGRARGSRAGGGEREWRGADTAAQGGVVVGSSDGTLSGGLGRRPRPFREIEWWSGRRHRQKRVGGKQGEDVPNLVLLDVP